MKKLLIVMCALLLAGCTAVQAKEEKKQPPLPEEKSVTEEKSTTEEKIELWPETLDGGELKIIVSEGTLSEKLPQKFLCLDADASEQLWRQADPEHWTAAGEAKTEEHPFLTMETDEFSLKFLKEDLILDSKTEKTWQAPAGTAEGILELLQQQDLTGQQYLEPQTTMENMLAGEIKVSALGKELTGTLNSDQGQQLREALNFEEGWQFVPQEPEKTGSEIARAEGSGYQIALYQNYASVTWKEQPPCWFQLPKGLVTSLTMTFLSMKF